MWLPKGRWGGSGKDQEFGISRCKLPYIRWINNKTLLQSTRNYIQNPMINHNGKEYEKICCCCQVASVVSDSARPHGLQPTRLLCPWDSPGKNTGVGCHFLLQCMKVESESEVTHSCLTLSDPMDCSPPGSSIHGIFRATVLEWGAIAFSQGHTKC